MKQHLDEIGHDILNGDLNKYWSGFETVAFALYDKKNVYLFNHPRMTNKELYNYQILKWNEQFNSCTVTIAIPFINEVTKSLSTLSKEAVD